MRTLTPQQQERYITALSIAEDELTSYVDTVGADGSLDDEEMPTNKLNDTIVWLRELREYLVMQGWSTS